MYFRYKILMLTHRGVEQLAARRAHNPEVVGSSPTPATNETVEAVALAVFLLSEKNLKKLKTATK